MEIGEGNPCFNGGFFQPVAINQHSSSYQTSIDPKPERFILKISKSVTIPLSLLIIRQNKVLKSIY